MEQNNLAAGEISGQGWQSLYFGLVEEKEKLKELYESDMAGFFIRLYYFLDNSIAESNEEKNISDRLTDITAEMDSWEHKNRILSLAEEYRIAAWENGFRQGFQTAARLNTSSVKGVLQYE